MSEPFVCPTCGRRSYLPRSMEEGWCPHCRSCTGVPPPPPPEPEVSEEALTVQAGVTWRTLDEWRITRSP